MWVQAYSTPKTRVVAQNSSEREDPSSKKWGRPQDQCDARVLSHVTPCARAGISRKRTSEKTRLVFILEESVSKPDYFHCSL